MFFGDCVEIEWGPNGDSIMGTLSCVWLSCRRLGMEVGVFHKDP